jgi:hypothetical protein
MFESGTTVKNKHTENRGKVLYGPFESVASYINGPAYLVEMLEGDSKGKAAVWTAADTSVCTFEVRQKVTFTYSQSGDMFELVAGPFPGDEGVPMWVIKDKDGVHDTSWEKHMLPVE